jgi:hypothetical protein
MSYERLKRVALNISTNCFENLLSTMEISREIEDLITARVEIYRQSLTNAVLLERNSADNIDIATVFSALTVESIAENPFTSNLTPIDEVESVSIVSEHCIMCLETSADLSPFNCKLTADCECRVVGCIDCWRKYLHKNARQDQISCPKCRQDIKGFLVSQGFGAIPRRCGYCDEAGHSKTSCSQRKAKREEIKLEIDEMKRCLSVKQSELSAL